MPRSPLRAALAWVACLCLAFTLPVRAEVAAPSPSTSPSASSAEPSASAAASTTTSSTTTVPLRKPRSVPTVVEVIDLSPGGDDQAFGLGAQAGVGALGVRGGGPAQGAANVAFVGAFGLGPARERVPWSLEPWVAFSITYHTLLQQRGYPGRFTEVGMRLVRRWPQGSRYEHQWLALGLGVVWTNTRPSSGFFDPSGSCVNDAAKASAAGLDCTSGGTIAPGGLLDLAIGLHETTVRRARWGFGARIPVQISANPGVGLLGFVYAQIGASR